MLQRTIPFIISVVTGFFIFVAFFFKPLSQGQQIILLWFSIISAFAMVVGLLGLLESHIKNIQRGKNTVYSLILLMGFALTLAFGIYSMVKFKDPFSPYTPLMWWYVSTLVPLQSTMFSLLAFFIASAAFRAFKAKNIEAILLLIAAILVMLGRIPWSEKIFAPVAEWIMSVPNLAAQRGIQIGIALGAIGMAFRILFGLEKPYLK